MIKVVSLDVYFIRIFKQFATVLQLGAQIIEIDCRRVFQTIYQRTIGYPSYMQFMPKTVLIDIITSLESLISHVRTCNHSLFYTS